jgi:ankyrin repeat protein
MSKLRIVAAAVLCAGVCLAAAAPDLRLVDAVKGRDHKAVTALLAEKADVNAAQPDGATALAWAVYLDDHDSALALLAAGAKVNSADEYGETPLTLACSTGDAMMVAKLLKAGADAKAARWNGETALMIAANTGSVPAVKELLAAGADVNAAESNKGQTALMWAAAEGHSDIVQVLIAAGADVKAASRSGFNALVFAAIKNDVKSVESLLAAGSDANYALPDGNKVLLVAAGYKSAAAAGMLVDHGADPNVADRGGITPLHTAAQQGSLDLVNKLLAKGANPNAVTAKVATGGRGPGGGGFFRGPSGELTPLMMAAKANQETIMKTLIDHGADPKLKAQDGGTLLMAAVGSGHVGVVKYAYQFDKDVTVATNTGDTLVHAAVSGTLGPTATQKDICEVIQYLNDIHAPLDEKNARGRTPIDVANGPPIDEAVTLITDLIVKSGAQPVHPSKR